MFSITKIKIYKKKPRIYIWCQKERSTTKKIFKKKIKPQVKCFWNYVVQIIAFCLWCDELNFLCSEKPKNRHRTVKIDKDCDTWVI